MFITDRHTEIANDIIWLFLFDCCAFDSPYTMPNDAPSNKAVAVNVMIFLFIIYPVGTPKLVHIISSG
jgi:hypothetical protein